MYTEDDARQRVRGAWTGSLDSSKTTLEYLDELRSWLLYWLHQTDLEIRTQKAAKMADVSDKEADKKILP